MAPLVPGADAEPGRFAWSAARHRPRTRYRLSRPRPAIASMRSAGRAPAADADLDPLRLVSSAGTNHKPGTGSAGRAHPPVAGQSLEGFRVLMLNPAASPAHQRREVSTLPTLNPCAWSAARALPCLPAVFPWDCPALPHFTLDSPGSICRFRLYLAGFTAIEPPRKKRAFGSRTARPTRYGGDPATAPM